MRQRLRDFLQVLVSIRLEGAEAMRDHGPTLQSPTVAPGQVRLIEYDPKATLAAADRDAMTAADIVLYERAFERFVAEILPLGGYAEPLSPIPDAQQEISPRALRLASEGWSVVQLVEASAGRRPHPHIDVILPAPLRPVAPMPVDARLFTANGLAG
jgi:hypothetical protein